MRKIVTGAFVSLDGVMQAPGGPEEDPTGGFRFGGWTAALWDDGLSAAVDRWFAEPFDLLLGRRTYDIFAAHWPYVQMDRTASDFNELNMQIADRFNRITKYVATHTPETLTWKNTEALGSDVVARVSRLKAEDGPALLTQGSTDLLQQLFAADLVDELRLAIFPVVLGTGKRLFGSGAAPAGLKLMHSNVTPSGAIVATYERNGEVSTGSFAMDEPTQSELQRRAGLR